MVAKRKPQPKRKTGAKRSKFTSVRVDEQTREKLERSAEQNGNAYSAEIAARLVNSFSNDAAIQRTIELGKILSDRMARAEIELEDLVLFAQFAEFVQAAVADAGEDKGTWHGYAGYAHFPSVLSEPATAEQDRLKIAQAVERDYQASRAFIASRGAPPADDVARRSAIGKGGPHSYEKIAEHKRHARRVSRIEANRSPGTSRAAEAQSVDGERNTR